MEIFVTVLKKEIIDKAVSRINQKFSLSLEVVDFKKDSKYGKATIKGEGLSDDLAFTLSRQINETILMITNHRWGKGI